MNQLSFRKALSCAISIFVFLCTTPSWAAGTGVDCVYPDTYYIFLPVTTVSPGRDAAPGDLIGSWTQASASPAWTCYRTSTSNGVIHLGISGYAPYTRYGNITVDGQNFAIYQSAVKEGLGYIARWRTSYNGQTSPWQLLTGATGVWTPPETLYGPIEYDNETRFAINIEVQVHFVKTGNNLTAGNVAPFDPIYIQPYRSLNGGAQINQGPYRIAQVNGLGVSAGGTCTTPDVSVSFQTVSISSFTGIGSTAGVTPFNLLFNNCPPGLENIGYTFSPTTSIADASQGVITPDASSTASGIGIQVMTDADTPIQYGTIYNLENYDPLNTSSYSVPLKAALYQTDSTVSAGKVKGAVTFTMIYK